MHQIKVLALVIVAVLLLSGFGATAIPSKAAHANKLASPPAVQWEKRIPASQETDAHSVKQTSDGGYIVAGTIGTYDADPSKTDIYLVKTDADGNKQWEKRWDSGGGHSPEHRPMDWGIEAQPTNDGGYIVVGTAGDYKAPEFSGYGGSFVYVIKTDASGNTQWEHRYYADHGIEGCPSLPGTAGCCCYIDNIGQSISQTSDGGYIVGGETNMATTKEDASGWTTPSVYLFKLSPNGSKQWEGWWGVPDTGAFCAALSVKQTSDGGYIVTGDRGREGGVFTPDLWLIKVGADGKKQWDKVFHGGLDKDKDPYGDHQDSRGYSVLQAADGGYVVQGVRNANYHGGGGAIWIIKTDTKGNTLWDKTYLSTEGNFPMAYSMEPTKDSGYVVAGWFYHGGPWLLLLKVDAQGNEQWHTTFGEDWPHDICNYCIKGVVENRVVAAQQTTDGGYVVAYPSGGKDGIRATLIKLGPEQ